MNPTSITFDTLDMQANGVTVSRFSGFGPAQIQNQTTSLAQSDGGILIKRRYDQKSIGTEGYLQSETKDELDALIDNFLTALNKKEKNLDVGYNGGTRRYVATPSNIIISRQEGLNVADFSVEFVVPDGYGSDITSTTLYNASNTAASASLSISVGGSYEASPLISVTVTAVTGGTSADMVIGNASTGEAITVNRTWLATDVLEIDSDKKTVFVNDAEVDFTGRFPVFEPGNNSISYSDTFTTRTVTVLATHTKRYL